MQFLVIICALLIQKVFPQVLQPPYFDIAKGKPIKATATCGEGPGLEEEGRELFCKLAQAPGRVAIKGQSCDYCYPGNHSIGFSNDGSEKWWQSPSLSRGLQYENVNITIDLGQMYHVAYIIIKAANSPRPGVWSLMRSKDGGRTFTPWYNFASSPSECRTYHKTSHLQPLTRDDTVLCKLEYSQVPPFDNGEIHISLVNGRPGAANFSFSPALQDWTTATHIRLHFMKVKTLLGDLMPLSLQDPTVTRRYYYSIKEISVGGRCMCNGFAERCESVDGEYDNYLCRCQHNTCGERCERCCPGFVQKKWRPRHGNDAFVCEPCNCHGHSSKCQYSEQVAQRKLSLDINGKREGGGVCLECQHNTYGINCEKCRPYYYRPEGIPITSRDACRPCNCSFQTSNGNCADGDGQCSCKPNYAGKKCDRCNTGFFNYPVCEECICDREGSVQGACAPDAAGNCRCKVGYTGKFCSKCDAGYYGFPACRPCNCLIQYGSSDDLCDQQTGQCRCKPGYGSRACDQCLAGYYNFPFCKQCDCDPSKTLSAICSAGSGVCHCKNNYSGLKCDQCADGFYGYPVCRPCECSSTGSISSTPCDKTTGKCACLPNFRGAKCDQCVAGFYGYPACLSCKCDPIGSFGTSCRSSDGQCSCRLQFQGRQCNKCQPGFYGFPNCQRCQCNPAGTKSGPGGIDCSSTSNGLCPCKDNVQGVECTECKHGFFNLQASNPEGCSNCRCNAAGTLSGLRVCSKLSGQCTCKRHVTKRDCSECRDGFYGLKELNLFGCYGCQCDIGGSIDLVCSKRDGQCKCRDNVIGRSCNKPRPGFYAPTLHQLSAEIEDGRAPDGNVISFDVQESKFPGYSGKGYSMINDMQPTIIATVNVFKETNYQIMFKYVLNQLTPVTAKVKVHPAGQRRGLYSGNIDFPTTQTAGAFSSKYAKLSKEGDPIFFPLKPGKWDIEISAPPSALLLDKVILIPEEYINADQLKEKVTDPCEVGKNQKVCNQFSYLNAKQQPEFVTVEAEFPNPDLPSIVLYNDSVVTKELDFNGMAKLSKDVRQLDIDIEINKNGNYVFVAQYYHDSSKPSIVDFYLRTHKRTQRGRLILNRCTYKFGCRQVAVNDDTGTVKVFAANAGDLKRVTFLSRSDSMIGIDSVVAIPVEKWNIDYVIPQLLCTTENNRCSPTTFPFPKKSVRVDGLAGPADPLPQNAIDPRSLLYVPSGSIRAMPKEILPAGRYYIVLHYYQPKNPSFVSQVSVDNVASLPGVVNFNYCPHASGCRTVVKNGGGTNVYVLANALTSLRINVPEGRDVWVDYVMYVPESAFTSSVLMQEPTSLVSEFSKECSKDHFYIKSTVKGFCRDGTFSLTTAFNNGTLPCNCDRQGSVNQNCDELGGQCRCKSQYITGRTCNRCRMGYYGFPNCRACQKCSNCDEITGECKCPPGVYGDRCDKCKPGTYGYDQVVGCRPCKCDNIGTKNANQTCDVITGQCVCNDNFDGRQCSECRAGYFGKPICNKCSCNPTGVTEKKM